MNFFIKTNFGRLLMTLEIKLVLLINKKFRIAQNYLTFTQKKMWVK